MDSPSTALGVVPPGMCDAEALGPGVFRRPQGYVSTTGQVGEEPQHSGEAGGEYRKPYKQERGFYLKSHLQLEPFFFRHVTQLVGS